MQLKGEEQCGPTHQVGPRSNMHRTFCEPYVPMNSLFHELDGCVSCGGSGRHRENITQRSTRPSRCLACSLGVRFQDQVVKPRVAADDRQRASGVERLHYEVLTVTKARKLPRTWIPKLRYSCAGLFLGRSCLSLSASRCSPGPCSRGSAGMTRILRSPPFSAPSCPDRVDRKGPPGP